MSGRIFVIGLGPGDEAMRTAQATEALAMATDLVGYAPYVARVRTGPEVVRHESDNRVELDRALLALRLAETGRIVAVVSAGDPGVFAMASAVFEAIEAGDPAWRTLDVSVLPGVSAMMAVAARVGAPLGGDFCALSLSDNLKPWTLVLQRLEAAASAGFVVALYNPISRARPWQLGAAFDRLRALLPPERPVLFATAVSRADETLRLCTLADARPDFADMRTLVLVGGPGTRAIARPDGGFWLYTARSASAE